MGVRKMQSQCLSAVLSVVCVLALGACTANKLIRHGTEACRVEPARPCADSPLQKLDAPARRGDGTPTMANYLLGFVEFDDEGKAYQPEQASLIFDRMASEAKDRDLCIVVFVHGWKHNAADSDGNVQDFRKLLAAIAAAELQRPPDQQRKVIGIYTGWRGSSVAIEFVDNLSFWARKDAARRVAEGSIRGLLGKVKAFRDTLNLQVPGQGKTSRGTRMLTIGHSFGGHIVYSALAQYYIDRAATSLIRAQYFPNAAASDHPTEKNDPREISAYGDLVVLINPAIEAMRYEPIRQLVNEQHAGGRSTLRYAPRQSPVLVEVTSVGEGKFDGDWATGIVFPLGRMMNTGFEATTSDPLTGEDERAQIQTALGHYRPFWTHDLDRPEQELTKEKRPPPDLLDPDPAADCRDFFAFEKASRSDGYLKSGWQRTYRSGAVLKEIGGGQYDPNNPFWIVRAHPKIILDHNDISAPVFVNFIAQLFGDLSRLRDESACATMRAR